MNWVILIGQFVLIYLLVQIAWGLRKIVKILKTQGEKACPVMPPSKEMGHTTIRMDGRSAWTEQRRIDHGNALRAARANKKTESKDGKSKSA
jgi:hypothetical protein